jgi:hypothetical protein
MKSRATLTKGTARESAEHGEGFSANGESQYSRRAAQPDNIKMRGFHEGERGTGKYRGPRSIADNIRFIETELRQVQTALIHETAPERIAKLKKKIEIKTRFLDRLRGELSGATRDASRVETIPGDFDIEPWDRV